MADDQTPAESGAQTPSETTTETQPDTPVAPAGASEAGADAAPDTVGDSEAGAKQTAPRKKAAARKRPAKKAAAADQPPPSGDAAAEETAATPEAGADTSGDAPSTAKPVVKKTTRKRTTKKAAAPPAEQTQSDATGTAPAVSGDETSGAEDGRPTPPAVLFQPPPAEPAPSRRRKSESSSANDADTSGDTSAQEVSGDPATDDAQGATDSGQGTTARKGQGRSQPKGKGQGKSGAADSGSDDDADDQADSQDGQDDSGSDDGTPRRRRRRGGRRRRGKGGQDGDDSASDGSDDSDETSGSGDAGTSGGKGDKPGATDSDDSDDADDSDDSDDSGDGQSQSSSSRRRRRRRRTGDSGGDSSGDSDSKGTKVRSAQAAEDEITSFTGSTRLEAKKQRRREGREAGRRRAPVISEAEFLARRESVDRKMVVRQRDDLTQIAVMEDKVLVEHYVARDSQTSLIGNVYLGRVQNVLPSMEAAFIDIGRGRNAVLYAGEVNWDALGAGGGGKERKIEQVLKPGQPVLVQVTKDPIGHKGARLTSQISLPGRFLVYVPEGNTSGISRKLPDTERNRLKTLLKEIVPSEAGVIVRTAAEGAAEEELRRDVARLTARWEDIKGKVDGGNAPQELYSEPDLTLKVVRDLFTEDIGELVVSGSDAWDMVAAYVEQVAPDLAERLTKHDDSELDAFAAYRIDEQIAKALERKVWLPSGGSLIIDRTEAMTVVDVNTGKFTGSGGNLEETVTKNNLEAAEEIVRQLRLRDIGGIIVIDFIDMVLESNRDLVLRRLIECLGRDRTRHQVAEVTSLGLVQMTRKRIGTGLLEAFSEQCEHCQGRGYHVHAEPVEQKRKSQDDDARRGRRGRRGKSDDQDGGNGADRGDSRKGSNGRNGGQNGADDTGSGDDNGDGVRRPTPAEFAAMATRPSDSSGDGPTPDGDSSAATLGDTQPEPAEAAEPDRSRGRGRSRQAKQSEQSDQTDQTDQTDQSDQSEQSEQSGADISTRAEPAGLAATEVPTEASTSARQSEEAVSAEPDAPESAEPQQPPVPEGPRIVTSTRRRGARRAAGPPRNDPAEAPT